MRDIAHNAQPFLTSQQQHEGGDPDPCLQDEECFLRTGCRKHGRGNQPAFIMVMIMKLVSVCGHGGTGTQGFADERRGSHVHEVNP
jgi:hypothetical protein